MRTPALLIRVSAVPKRDLTSVYKSVTDFSFEMSVTTQSTSVVGFSFKIASFVLSSPKIERPANTNPLTPALACANAIASTSY